VIADGGESKGHKCDKGGHIGTCCEPGSANQEVKSVMVGHLLKGMVVYSMVSSMIKEWVNRLEMEVHQVSQS
jgi:hypothetical protein